MGTKTCTRCKRVKSVRDFYVDRRIKSGLASWCKTCHKEYESEHRDHYKELRKNWTHTTGRQVPMADNKKCSSFLGVHIAERALSRFFDHIVRMPYGFPGYDFICGQGYKIDVKSSCLRKREKKGDSWNYVLKCNDKADYFLLIAFDNRANLEPIHVWLVPGNVLNAKKTLCIVPAGVDKWEEYERPLDKITACCNAMRGIA